MKNSTVKINNKLNELKKSPFFDKKLNEAKNIASNLKFDENSLEILLRKTTGIHN